MTFHKDKYNVLFKAVEMVLVCLFCADTIVLADTSTLAPQAGNPKIYQKLYDMMEERLVAHQGPIDELIRQNSTKARSLSAIPYLEEEFMGIIDACGAANMLTRLNTTLRSSGGKIQVIFVKNEDDLPLFEGRRAWGHAGAYISAFALEDEKHSKEGRRKIIARLFHEIRARSTRAKELFDEGLIAKNPDTPQNINSFIRSARENFEKDNVRLQHQVERNGRIIDKLLVREFVNLVFAMHPDVINRDYMMAGDKARRTDSKVLDKVISDVRALLAKADGKEIKRKDVDKEISRLLQGLCENNKPYFSPAQADKISKIIKLNERLEVLRLSFLCKDNGSFVFKSNHLTLILRSSRKEDEMIVLINILKELYITESHHIVRILISSRKAEDVSSVINTLKMLGITESNHIASILASSRKAEDVQVFIRTLKELGITGSTHLAQILHSAREKEEIRSVVKTLKMFGITKSAHMAMILHSSRKEKEIKSLINTLKMLGITGGYHLALILTSSRKEEEVKELINTLRDFGITEGAYIAPILTNSRNGEEIKTIIKTLKKFGITEGAYLAPILTSSRKEKEVKSLVKTLRRLGITEGAHLAYILTSSRKETEIKSIVRTLKGLGITKGYHLSLILHSARKKKEIVDIINTLERAGIKGGANLSLILRSARKEEEIKSIVDTLKELGITEGAHLAYILTSSRKETEIKSIVRTLKGLGITKGYHLSIILRGARKEKEIRSIVGTLKELGITESYHLALILASSRKGEEMKGLVNVLKGFGISEGFHTASVLISSRKEGEIKGIIKTLKEVGINESYCLSLVLRGSRKENEIKSYATEFMKLKAVIPGFNIPNVLVAKIIANPEFITRNFSYMRKEKAKMPPLDRLLNDEEKKYLQFRLLLRQFGLSTVYGLIDILAEDSGKREELKEYIRKATEEEKACLSALLKVKTISEDDYGKAGLLLFSCDEKIRVGARDWLIERHLDRIKKYKDESRKSLAYELLLEASMRHNIYANLLKNDLRQSSYIAYLHTYLKCINLILYYRDQPESLRQIRRKFREFKVRSEMEHSRELSETELMTEFADSMGYDIGAVLLALGKIHVKSLDAKIGEDATLMDFVPALPIVSEEPSEDEQPLHQEWYENHLNTTVFLEELSRLLRIENILEKDKSTFIFSEKVTFDNGLGIFLPKLARSGIKVAAIVTNDKQKALIDELNKGKSADERIAYAETIADVTAKVHTARYYYFKVYGDPVTDLRYVTIFDITDIVKKIIDALGKVSGIVEHEKLKVLREAARRFAEAA